MRRGAGDGGRRAGSALGAGIGAAHSKRWKPTTCDASNPCSSSFRWGSTRQISGLGKGVCRKKETVQCGAPRSFFSAAGSSISWKLWTHTMSPGRRNSRTTEAKPALTFSYAWKSAETTVPSPPRPPLWRSGIEL